MELRPIAAVVNGLLVLTLDLLVFGAPTLTIAVIELALAIAAAISTWHALRITTPKGRRALPATG